MSIYYTSLENSGGEIAIPSGGFFSIPFPKTQEKSDAWNTHTGDNSWAVIPADGILWATAEIVWKSGGAYTLIRDAFLHNNLRIGTDRRQYLSGQQCMVTKAVQIKVSRGDTIALQVAHDQGAAQSVTEARLKLSLHTGILTPASRRIHVRAGTDPGPGTLRAEAPSNAPPGGGGTLPPDP